MKSILLAIVFCFAIEALSQGNQTPGQGPKQPIILRHADSLIGTTVGDVMIRELVGNVHLEQGNVTVYCDHAIQYTAENRAECHGNVRIIQGTVTMYMPRGVYFGDQDIAKGEGGVRIVDRRSTLIAQTGVYSTKTNIATFITDVTVEDDSVKIYADTIIYQRSSEESFAYGRVLMKSKFQNAFVIGDSARNIPKVSYSIIKGRPVLIQVDSVITGKDTTLPVADTSIVKPKSTIKKTTVVSKQKVKNPSKQSSTTSKSKVLPKVQPKNDSVKVLQRTEVDSAQTLTLKNKRLDTLSITGNVIESFRAQGAKRFVITGDVEIVRKTISAKSGKCIYDDEHEIITLREHPNVWADSLQLYADSISIHVPQRKLRTIDAYYSSIMIMRNDTTHLTRKNQVTGDEIHITITEDTIRGIQSLGNAKSLYFMLNEEKPDGASRTTCDSLKVIFEEGELERIVWLGGVNSEFFPENLVGGGTEKFYLPMYKWDENKPSIPIKVRLLNSDNFEVEKQKLKLIESR